jgi:hypothetical protein
MILYASLLCVRAGSMYQASFEVIRQVREGLKKEGKGRWSRAGQVRTGARSRSLEQVQLDRCRRHRQQQEGRSRPRTRRGVSTGKGA